MIKLHKKEQLEELKQKNSKKMLRETEKIIGLLDDNYGANRDVEKDIGGYITLLETKEDVTEIKANSIKETSYCKIYNKVSIEDDEYNSCMERIYVKSKNREEIRFALYRSDDRYILRNLDLSEIQLLELIKLVIKDKVFSRAFRC